MGTEASQHNENLDESTNNSRHDKQIRNMFNGQHDVQRMESRIQPEVAKLTTPKESVLVHIHEIFGEGILSTHTAQ